MLQELFLIWTLRQVQQRLPTFLQKFFFLILRMHTNLIITTETIKETVNLVAYYCIQNAIRKW